jgi:hypothetical protein
LFRSKDRGQNWTVFSGVKPPTLSAEFVGFTMTMRGQGRITIHQNDDTETTLRGHYTYVAFDDGKTWTGPTFLSDDLISADTPAFPTLQESILNLESDSTLPGASGVVPSGKRPAPFRGRGG